MNLRDSIRFLLQWDMVDSPFLLWFSLQLVNLHSIHQVVRIRTFVEDFCTGCAGGEAKLLDSIFLLRISIR